MDRQGILDKLTSIETTAKLLVKALAFSKEVEEPDDLCGQTKIFLEQAQKLVDNLSNTFNRPRSPEKVNGNHPRPT